MSLFQQQFKHFTALFCWTKFFSFFNMTPIQNVQGVPKNGYLGTGRGYHLKKYAKTLILIR